MLLEDEEHNLIHILGEARGWTAAVILESGDLQKLLDYLSVLGGAERVWGVAFGRVFSHHDKVYITVLPNSRVADIFKPANMRKLRKQIDQFTAVEKYIVRTRIPQANE